MTQQSADSFEVSPQQEQLWLDEPDGPSGRIQAIVSLTGDLDPVAVRQALRQAVQRHEILRTTFVHQPGIRVPLQAVASELEPAWTVADVTEIGADQRPQRLEDLAAEQLEESFDFAAGPLVRALLVRVADREHRLVLTISSLCADAASATVLTGEVAHRLAAGAAPAPVEDPLQYADFSAWQRELQAADDDEAASARKFWSGLEDAVDPEIPFARSVDRTPVGSPARIPIELDGAPRSRLEQEAARYGAGTTAFVQAAWHVVLGRSAGEDQVTVALLGGPRRHADLEGAIGAFARPVPISTDLPGSLTFAELLQEVKRASDEAGVWQDYMPAGARKHAVGFIAAEHLSAGSAAPQAAITGMVLGGSRLRAWLTCIAGGGELDVSLDYDSRFLAPPVAQRLAGRLRKLLDHAASDAGTPIGELALLEDAERELMLHGLNDTAAEAPAVSAHELFAGHAAGSPQREAVVDEHGTISYAELDARANQLANRLRRLGVGPDVCVGLCMDRSIEMVVGLLGILKAGGAYVPLHYEHPPARLAHQLETVQARVIVTQEPLLHRLPEVGGAVICLDRDRAELDAESAQAPESGVSGENLAYVIYTSGSTGAPKGVCVTHANLVNYASYIARRLGADQEPLSFGVVTSISTDLGNTSVFGALCSGGTLVLISPAAAADPGAFARALETSRVDVLKITPSHQTALLAGNDPRVLPHRWLVLGGERAGWDLIAQVREQSGCEILNHYGPTETTIGSCTFAVPDAPAEYASGSVPIGRPIANTACYVLDERLAPVPIGAPGQLHIAGAGVARGYAGAPEMTAERFLPNPFAAGGARMYDTGDLARWLPDGTIEFLGRVDEQVKIRGYRVEPAEVEAALRTHPLVREAVAVVHAAPTGEQRLVAYAVLDGSVGEQELKLHLAEWLPEFMLPSSIAVLDSLPRTPSGKIDRLALPDPGTGAPHEGDYVAPRSPMEEALAGIWAEVLGVPRVGVEDDFFALGGHSLLATQVVAHVRSDFAVDLPLHSLFTHPTVASLTAEIVQLMGEVDDEETARLMAELEGMSDEEAERLLAGAQPEV